MAVKAEWALTTWANRASATYVNIDQPIDGVVIDAYGRKYGTAEYLSGPRRPVKMEGGNPAYVMYDSADAGNVPVIRISEEA